MPNSNCQTGGEARVVYVRKEHAKVVKDYLKECQLLDNRFRMLPAARGSDIIVVQNDVSAFIAIPVLDGFDEKMSHGDVIDSGLVNSLIAGVSHQICPYSTKLLGNGQTNHYRMSRNLDASTQQADCLSLIHLVILDIAPVVANADIDISKASLAFDQTIINRVLQLDSIVCPVSRRRQFLEIFGDDRTVVVPPGAFEGDEFLSILRDVARMHNCNNTKDCTPKNTSLDTADEMKKIYSDFWRRLALAHDSPRIVRRGGIDPSSKIRESGHRVVWPSLTSNARNQMKASESPSWIRVTEQGIKQSFDLSKVMFSRGNVSEKIRFGKQLVQEGDVILDMYAGIGYYTLPAVIHGKASKVYACEWNEHAVTALRFNVKDNKIQDKVEIYYGDCRESAKKHNIIGLVDRVSLGLLPSSEGGWSTAVRALKVASGGWLHIHGNVPALEVESWTLWVCHRLDALAREEGRPENWVILCDHVERVKSFAPTVFHYVADVFVGIPSETSYPRGYKFLHEEMGAKFSTKSPNSIPSCRAWMLQRSSQTWIPALDETTVRPSCALSPDGVLSQEWMR